MIHPVGRLERRGPERAGEWLRRPARIGGRARLETIWGELAFRMETAVRSPSRRRAAPSRARALDHLVLLKPRVMSLVVFTGAVGFVLAPGTVDWMRFIATLSAMAAGAGACGALNMWWDADIDANMARTAMRPIPRGVVPPLEALAIGILLSVVSVAGLAIKVNVLAAALLALTIAIYVPLYT